MSKPTPRLPPRRFVGPNRWKEDTDLPWVRADVFEYAAMDNREHCSPVWGSANQTEALMVRFIALCVGMVFYALGRANAEEAALSRCKRSVDQYGPRYEEVSGAYRSHGLSPGGGKFVTILPRDAEAPLSVTVTDEVFDVVRPLTIGTRITLVSRASHSLSGAEPPYSCIELAR